jgi:hypothetical protein
MKNILTKNILFVTGAFVVTSWISVMPWNQSLRIDEQ